MANYLPNIQPLMSLGINPKTGLPYKSSIDCQLKENIKRQLRIVDEQDAINRFQWYNLPNGLSSQEIERLLYYRGQLCFFYMESVDQFYLLPYALDGDIDFYGRFVRVHPLPFAEGTETDDENKKRVQSQRQILSMLKLKVQYDIELDELTAEDLKNRCVILRDYSNQMSQTIISRQVINDPLLDVMANCIPYMRTALMNSTGIQGVRVNNEDEQSNVFAANASVEDAALTGKKFVPMQGTVDFQDLTGGEVAKCEEFTMAMQSLDNYRLSLYGLDNGGIFEKKAHVLESEESVNSGSANMVMQDGLSIRQRFCDIVNSIWGLGIWCDVSESALNMDRNGDGEIAENEPDTISHDDQEIGGEV